MSEIAKEPHEFVTDIVAAGRVWTLEDDEGCANIDSEIFETEDGDPEIVLCYWSDEKAARECSKTQWPDHEVGEISLSDFMENWCVGMQSDGVVAGLNFDAELVGTETQPLNLLLQLFEELRKNGKELSFEHYPSQDAFEQTALSVKTEDKAV